MKQAFKPTASLFFVVPLIFLTLDTWNARPVIAQSPRFEMRGAWIATVRGLDWPDSNESSQAQQQDLVSIFDGLAGLGINAVFFQVRTEADAMYASDNEPWSAHLTGVQGRAPDPFYDPLELAVQLAHERGMELHAWVNPFRAISNAGSYEIDDQHITVREPGWILDFGSLQMLDPGIPDVRDYVVEVVRDIVQRYDVDGIHFDDYFYPYNPQVGTHDLNTFLEYGGEFSNQADWRRDNINRFVESVHDAVIAADPTIKFGISPFGIWQSGNPEGVTGLSAYDVIYADAVHWLGFETIDYLAPQLYWPFGGGQDFGLLADWWASVANGRHIYPGLAAYKVDAVTAGGTQYAANELPRQIRFSRAADGVQGNLLFRAQNLFSSQNRGLDDSLRTDLYAVPAFTPPMQHRDVFPPDPVTDVRVQSVEGGIRIEWDPPLTGFTYADRYAVYRTSGDPPSDARDVTDDMNNLLALSWEPQMLDDAGLVEGETYHYVVTGLTPNSIESEESQIESVVALSVGTETVSTPAHISLDLYPNPAHRRARIEVQMDGPGPLEVIVVDMLGRRVRTLFDERLATAGRVQLEWMLDTAAGSRVAPGSYYVVVTAAGRRTTRGLIVLR